MNLQTPPQLRDMLSQPHTPLRQDWPLMQTVPQPPQFWRSKLGLVQRPPQQMVPEGQPSGPQKPPSMVPASFGAPPHPLGVQVPGAQSVLAAGRQTPAPSQIRSWVKTDPAQVAGAQITPGW
jgi:hypothetical protein